VEHLVRGSELDPTIQGYHKWLLAAAAHPEVYLAPDAVPELMAIVALHAAQPHSYSEDCRHLFGKVQVPYRLADSEVYKQAVLVSRVFLRGRGQKHRMATNLNLHEMAYKAVEFRRQLVETHPTPGKQPHAADFLHDAVVQYTRFVHLVLKNKNIPLVPTLEIDLIWRAHMLHAEEYANFSKLHYGSVTCLDVHPDESVLNGKNIPDTLAETQCLFWAQEDFGTGVYGLQGLYGGEAEEGHPACHAGEGLCES